MLQRKKMEWVVELRDRPGLEAARLLWIPGLHHRTPVSWANSALRVVEKTKAKMCEGFVAFCLDQLIDASFYYIEPKGKFESCWVIRMWGRIVVKYVYTFQFMLLVGITEQVPPVIKRQKLLFLICAEQELS